MIPCCTGPGYQNRNLKLDEKRGYLTDTTLIPFSEEFLYLFQTVSSRKFTERLIALLILQGIIFIIADHHASTGNNRGFRPILEIRKLRQDSTDGESIVDPNFKTVV